MNRRQSIGKSKQLNLKDAETYDLAARLAELHGDSLSGAVKTALREKLARDSSAQGKEERYRRLMELSQQSAGRVVRTITDEEAIGYDEFGLPS